MKNYAIQRYQPADKPLWNDFIGRAKNATFLFNRDFMEYHSDRFRDFSLMVSDRQKLLAVLPANRSGDTVFSHQGLSYGGLVFDSGLRFENVLEIFRALLEFLHSDGVRLLQLKTIPAIYCNGFSQETTYLLFTLRAQLIRRDCLSVIDLRRDFAYSGNKLRNIRKASGLGLEIAENNDFPDFWQHILQPNLMQRHQASPVHTIREITLLQSRFPKNIRQFNAYHQGKIAAGVTVFETGQVAHCQYISGDPHWNKMGALDYLMDHLIKNVFANKLYFDFGISNENHGQHVNGGLLHWKESFGASVVTQDFYQVETAGHYLLTNVLI